MPNPLHAKEILVNYFFANPGAFSLVAGIGVGVPPDSEIAPQVLVFVEPAPDCELDKLWQEINTQMPAGETFLMLKTGRFLPLAATGISIGVYAPRRFNVPPVSAGTCGAIVKASNNRQYLLTCNHNLAFNGRARPRSKVTAPGTLDDSKGGVHVASLGQFVELQPSDWRPWTPTPPQVTAYPNLVDCALAELTPAGITYFGTPVPINVVSTAVTGPVPVKKTGRTTGTTQSTLCIWSASTYIDFSFQTSYFSGLLGAVGVAQRNPRQYAFAALGDSGSLATANGEALGLIMARAYCSGVYSPIVLPPGLAANFVGYVVLMCPMDSVRQELQARMGGVQLEFFQIP
jgi:hypothetical protein